MVDTSQCIHPYAVNKSKFAAGRPFTSSTLKILFREFPSEISQKSRDLLASGRQKSLAKLDDFSQKGTRSNCMQGTVSASKGSAEYLYVLLHAHAQWLLAETLPLI